MGVGCLLLLLWVLAASWVIEVPHQALLAGGGVWSAVSGRHCPVESLGCSQGTVLSGVMSLHALFFFITLDSFHSVAFLIVMSPDDSSLSVCYAPGTGQVLCVL